MPTDSSDVRRAIAERLRRARLASGMSLNDVTNATGGVFKASVVGAYERGDRGISSDRLHDLAVLYGVSAGDLFPAGYDPGLAAVPIEARHLIRIAAELVNTRYVDSFDDGEYATA